MKHFFTLVLLCMLPSMNMLAEESQDTNIRYILMKDGQVIAIPEKTILGETEENGIVNLSLEGSDGFSYCVYNVASITDSYTLPEMNILDFGFSHEDNDQVYKDVVATITEEGDYILVTADVPVLGKRLRPNFTLTEGTSLWIGNEQQISGQTSHRYTSPIIYTLAQPKHYIYTVAEDKGAFKPFGRPCKVSVNYLTDKSTSEYAVPSIYLTFGDGTTWNKDQWIGQTLPDGTNTKEEWIDDCTFRLDGAGIWPDIEIVEGCQIRGRGNSSWSWNPESKNPYRIKFPKKAKQSPFNLTKDRQWVFISNKQKGSMTTNAIAQKIAAMVDCEAICNMIPIDLHINGHYRGSYNFTAKIGVSANSVDIDETVGCLLEMDDYFDEDYKFRDNIYYLPVNVKDPDFTEEDPERIITFDGITSSFDKLVNTIAYGDDVSQVIDMDTWARFWLVNDLVCNQETYHPKSCYLFNENPAQGDKWKFGPVWDFDWAYGYESTHQYFISPADVDIFEGTPLKPGQMFFDAIRNSEAGKRAYYKEWVNFIAEGRVEELLEYIDDYTKFVLPSFEHNNEAEISERDYTDYTALADKAKQWLTTRANFIYKNLETFDISPDIVDPEDYGQPTTVSDTSEGSINRLVDVYSINDQRVRHQVPFIQSLDGMEPGLYIVDGKVKVVS